MYGQKIKEIRKYNNLSQEDFGKILGISRASVSELERNNRDLKASELKKICDELNVNPRVIFNKDRVVKLEEEFRWAWEREFDDNYKFSGALAVLNKNGNVKSKSYYLDESFKSRIKQLIIKEKEKSFRRGYNQRLKDEGKTEEKDQHLYL